MFVVRGPPARKLLSRVRKPNLHSDREQDSNSCAWRPLGPQSTHESTVPRRSNLASSSFVPPSPVMEWLMVVMLFAFLSTFCSTSFSSFIFHHSLIYSSRVLILSFMTVW
ncbi:hypothetical protein E2C01_038554 [Portunus trituberculatus]|uniref:Uncharacterized protein n=1 Tax=Portunus trituberculatus TaxID=210409 RepID=A0A5B7FIA8_PORTR|nr:hypothetical protein [Portunus trituberculatus]